MKKFNLLRNLLRLSETPIGHSARSRAICFAALTLSAAPISSAIAAANPLFHSAPASMQREVNGLQANRLDRIKKEPTTRKSKLVVIDVNALRSDSVDITLDSGETLTYVKSRIETNGDDFFTWYGDLQNKQGSAILVANKGIITGSVRHNGALYKIEPAGNGLHVFIETDSSKLPPDHPPQ